MKMWPGCCTHPGARAKKAAAISAKVRSVKAKAKGKVER
jgi:hypothetical protein